MLEKEIKLTAKFKYLQKEDFESIEQQVKYFLREHNGEGIDLIKLISNSDYEPYLTEVYIYKNQYKLDLSMNDVIDDEDNEIFNVITLDAKYGDGEEIRNEIINYTIICFFNESSLIYRFFNYYAKFSIKNIDRVSNIQ